MASCAIVPVGVTKYRKGLYKMPVVDERTANDILDRVLPFSEECFARFGTRLFFCSDEIFIKAKRPLPEEEYYEGYVQLENGVGMLRSMEMEFMSALRQLEPDTPLPAFCDWHRLSGGSFYPGTGGQSKRALSGCAGYSLCCC